MTALTWLAELPELGKLNRKQIALLVGLGCALASLRFRSG